MPENNFERHVQDKMDELRLRPSPAVWSAVELELRKKKRRRVVFFIFLLAGLGLLSYPGYLLFDHSKPLLTDQKENVIRENNTINNDPQSPVTETQASPVSKEIKNPVKEKVEKTDEPVVVPLKENKTTKEEKRELTAISAKKKLIIVNSNTKVSVDNQRRMKEVSVFPVLKNEVSEKRNTVTTTKNETTILENDTKPNLIQEEKTGEATIEKQETIKADSAEVVASLTGSNPVVLKKKSLSKIRWGLDISAGATFNRDKAFPFAASERLADITYGTPQSSAGGSSAGYIYPPSSVTSGPAFKAGIFAELNLSKRSSLSSGLRYVYLSEKTKVGQYTNAYIVNSYSNYTTSGFYGGNQKSSFTNVYHFIEIPLTYQLKLNKRNKTALFWNVGLSASYLVGSKSLVYDTTAGGVYYKAFSEINKLHFNLNTGLSIRFGNRSRMPWSLGPDLSFDMSKLMKQDPFTKKRYLLYGGISAKIFLPVKRR
jgi:Outer membrane protein beta-barrel domain